MIAQLDEKAQSQPQTYTDESGARLRAPSIGKYIPFVMLLKILYPIVLLLVPISHQSTRSVMSAIPRRQPFGRDLDQPMRSCVAAYGYDLRTDCVVPKPGKDVNPSDVINCTDGDAGRVKFCQH